MFFETHLSDYQAIGAHPPRIAFAAADLKTIFA